MPKHVPNFQQVDSRTLHSILCYMQRNLRMTDTEVLDSMELLYTAVVDELKEYGSKKRTVVELLIGMHDGVPHSYEEIADLMQITKEGVRLIDHGFLRHAKLHSHYAGLRGAFLSEADSGGKAKPIVQHPLVTLAQVEQARAAGEYTAAQPPLSSEVVF